MKKKKNFLQLFITVIIIVAVLDQITKMLVLKLLYSPVQLIPNFLSLSYTTNKGIIFGFLQNFSWIPIFISFIVIVIIIFYYDQLPKTKTGQILWAMIMGGAIGNLLDRILQGHVIDFISFSFWPSFNIADSAITIGIVGLIIYLWKK